MLSNKIGLLAFGDKHGGGVYQYTQSSIDALKKDRTNEYVVFCNTDDKRFDKSGLEVRKIDEPIKNILIKIIRVLQRLFFIRKSYFFTKQELYVFKDIGMFLSPAISVYPHFYIDKPFIFTLHDMQERYYPDFFSKYTRVLRWLNNRALSKTATKIICESSFVKNDIIKFTGVDKNKIHIVQSPPPEDFLNYQFSDKQFEVVKQKYNLPSNYIFYPAQCWLHKNHIKLVEAFKEISGEYNDTYLIFTGSQLDNYNNLMNKVDELGLDERVKHLGYVDYEDLPYLYKMSKMLVMATMFESVSIPIYEAFALEVPVCSSNVVALPEQIGGAGLLFDPNDGRDIAEKLSMYLDNEELRIEKARAGLKSVTNFNHENYKGKLLKVLNI